MDWTQIDAVLFDFDGTLAPNLDLPGMRKAVVAFTLECGVPPAVFDGQYIVEIIDVSTAWLREQSVPSVPAAEYSARAHGIVAGLELDAASRTRPFEGVRSLLLRLADSGVRTGVVTRNCRQAVMETFPDILEHVDAVHARGDVDYLKPDPRHLQAALSALGCDSARAMMVGDGALDMQVGKVLGMYCVGVLSGSSDKDRLTAAGADRVLDSCLDLDLP